MQLMQFIFDERRKSYEDRVNPPKFSSVIDPIVFIVCLLYTTVLTLICITRLFFAFLASNRIGRGL